MRTMKLALLGFTGFRCAPGYWLNLKQNPEPKIEVNVESQMTCTVGATQEAVHT